jgi:3-deoxy-D-manno-octulosonate 8-phosphate phosphatase (KDO 8-P phosphatase)
MAVLEAFKDIHTFVFDVDGVFTDGSLLITEEGDLLRRMSVRDGFAVKMALRSGYRILIITGGSSEGVRKRLQALGIDTIYAGIQDKLTVFRQYFAAHPVNMDAVLYMGDDVPDLDPMREVGLPSCPSDAEPSIQAMAKYISPLKGGHGCVRDVIEKTMRVQGKWPFP